MRLAEALDATATGVLRRIASAHGLAVDDSTTRAELIARVVDRLTTGDYLGEQIAGLEQPARDLLGRARAHEAGEVRALLADRDAPGAADVLIDRGLAFRVFAASGPLRGEVLAVPSEVLATLPEPSEPDGPPALAAPPGADRRGSDPAFSLFCLASTITRQGAQLEADVRAWSEEPGGWPWEARWTFLRHLAHSSGLFVRQADGSPGLSPTASRVLDQPRELSARLWRAYLRDRAFSELAACGFEDGLELAAAVPLREAIVGLWGELPPGRWLAVTAVLDWMRASHPSLVREQLTARGLILAESLDWQTLEATVLRYALLGPLYWLGAVATSADGTRLARRTLPIDEPPAGEGSRAARRALVFDEPAAGEGSRVARSGVSADEPATAGGSRAAGQAEMVEQPGAGDGARGAGPSAPLDEPAAGGGTRAAGRGESFAEPAPVAAGTQPALPLPLPVPTGSPGDADASRRLAVAAAVPAERGVPPAHEPCQWSASGELIAPPRAALGTLLAAERYLVLRERGRPSTYALVGSHVGAALGSGGSLEDCRALLRRLTAGPLPRAIEERLSDWDRRFGALSIRPAVLLEARGTSELDAVLADEGVRGFVRARLSERVAEVAAADALELAAALRAIDHLPHVDAALRLAADTRRAYAGLVDEQVLEFLLISLLAFARARPEQLASLEGSATLLERLERQFPPERLRALRADAARLALALDTPRSGSGRGRRTSGRRTRSPSSPSAASAASAASSPAGSPSSSRSRPARMRRTATPATGTPSVSARGTGSTASTRAGSRSAAGATDSSPATASATRSAAGTESAGAPGAAVPPGLAARPDVASGADPRVASGADTGQAGAPERGRPGAPAAPTAPPAGDPDAHASRQDP